MCGRFALATPPEKLRQLLDFKNQPNFPPRYNIAPSQPVLAIRQPSGSREAALLQWGLVPGWMKPERLADTGNRPQINARGETVHEKPFFRDAYKHRRCLIPADAFYEWQRRPSSAAQPYCVRRRDTQPFMMAGIWDLWQGADGSEIESCAVITTAANQTLTPVHHRMPVMLAQDHWESWLATPSHKSAAFSSLSSLLVPAPEHDFTAYPVSKEVNKVSNDSAALLTETLPVADKAKPEKKKSDDQMDLF